MPGAVQCPYYNGYCNLAGTSQSQYQIDNYCVTESSKENWQSCANYQGANATYRIEKRVR
ncbi:MAG: hypothetical protein LBC75_00955 [Fibromonadaceae bacterium]|jgi:hypothetical protein|nr:hypothetical protein [Fibromonadaceae bacterium]